MRNEKFTLTWASPRKRYLHYNRDPTRFTDTLSFPMTYWCFQFSTNVGITVCNIMLIPSTHWSSRWSPLIGIGWSKGVTLLSNPSWFLSFSCSFRQKPYQIVGFHTKIRGCPPPVLEILDPPLIGFHVWVPRVYYFALRQGSCDSRQRENTSTLSTLLP